jgi:large subunit ribosomal protein L22
VEAAVEQRTARAVAKWLRVSPTKVRLVADLVRGRTVADALTILKFTPNRPAAIITRVVSSAVANAENVHGMDKETLRIKRIMVDKAGPTLKRWQPVSRGMAHPILKPLSHILVEVAEDIELSAAKTEREEARRRTRRGPGGRGRGRAPQAEEAPAAAPTAETTVEAKPAKRARKAAKPQPADAADSKEKPKPRRTRSAKAKKEPAAEDPGSD